MQVECHDKIQDIKSVPVISSSRHKPVDETILPTALEDRVSCRMHEQSNMYGDTLLVAHFVEHTLGWTLRLDRVVNKVALEPINPCTVVGAIMPNAHTAQWSLPMVDWIDPSLYPCMVVEYESRMFTVAIIQQTKLMARSYFDTTGLLATPPKDPS